ncbi:uncharacterized protein LOC123499384 isoform X1 [Portunus trituberculatus]|uniref:uncharacterized protein LOC123499384 isoform X1 n=1 Tax=Portunus trituberculatus TaxID=210409 RepID=UPI001E1D1E8D|nr:uncharacterized protein LOC123499384 isoform X1 [Portunus trituberculatus]
MNPWSHHRDLRRSGRLRTAVLWAWVWSFAWAWAVCGATGTCPKVCECKWRDGKQTVSCPDAEFIDIPRGLDPSTQVLNLKHNNLQILPRDAFVDTGLVNLQKVWLNYCNLKHLDRGAFNMLANLVELDLSHNLLRAVPSEALADVPGLRELRLSNNYISSLPEEAFTKTPDLVHLVITQNHIDIINDRAFRGLTRLEVLKLSNNRLPGLDSSAVHPLVAIHELHLDGNPWHCDCRLRPLRRWMIERNVAFLEPPTCVQPDRVKNKSWQALQLDEFVCVPKLTAVAPRVLAAHGENVSLSCRVENDVDATVSWLLGDRLIRNNSERHRVLETAAASQDSRLSNLTLAGAGPRDQGTYRCVAINKAGSAEANLTLQVSDEVAEVRLVTMDRVFVTGGLLTAMAMIVVVLLLLTAILLRRRQQARLRRGPETDHKTETPQLSQDRGSISSDSHPKLADYHIVPTNDLDEPSPLPTHSDKSWMLRDASVDDFPSTKEIDKSSSYNESEQRKLSKPRPSASGKASSPSTVSYVEIPKSELAVASLPAADERLRWREAAAESKDSRLLQMAGQRGSQLSMASGSRYPDLLDLHYTQQQKQQLQQQPRPPLQLLNPAYCTLPRSSSGLLAGATAGSPPGLDSLFQETSFSLPSSIRYRCASWVDLGECETASTSLPSYPRPHVRPQLSLPSDSPILKSHRDTLAELLNVHRGERGAAVGAAGGSKDPCNLEYHAAQLEKFLLEYRKLQEQLYRMKESYEASHRTEGREGATLAEFNAEDDNENVPPPCPETPTSSHPRYPQAAASSDSPEDPMEDPSLASEPLRSILKRRYEEGGRGLPGLQGLLGLHGLQGLQTLKGLQEAKSLQNHKGSSYSKSASFGESPQPLRPSLALPSLPPRPDPES